MAHKLTLPTLSVLALAGAGAGIHLGRSAIAEIDPIYFSEPASRFHSDLTPSRSIAGRPAAVPMVEAPLELGPDCYGCAAPAAERQPIYEARPAGFESGYAAAPEPVEPARFEPQPSEGELQRQADLALVQRYASYPVSGDEAGGYASAEAQGTDQREAPALD